MKRTAIMVLVLMGIFAINAFAQYGVGGYNPGYGRGHGMHGCIRFMDDVTITPRTPAGEIVINNDAEARAAVTSMLNESFKGYTVVDSASFDTPRGHKAYFVYTKDAGENDFTFFVNPFGGVRGPIAGKATPRMPLNQ